MKGHEKQAGESVAFVFAFLKAISQAHIQTPFTFTEDEFCCSSANIAVVSEIQAAGNHVKLIHFPSVTIVFAEEAFVILLHLNNRVCLC